MKKINFFVLAMLLALFSSATFAQVDVTSLYLQNPSFDTPPIAFEGPGNTANSEATRVATSGLGSKVYNVPGWTAEPGQGGASSGNAQYARAATGLFNVDYTSIPDNFNGVEFPTSTRTGAFLAVSGGYGTKVVFTQTVTLPAGQYTLTYDVYDQNPDKAFTNYFGFVPTAGTAVYGSETTFTSTWTTYSVSFLLNEETTGKISIGIQGNTGNSGANAHLAIDSVKLFYSDLSVALNAQLTALIATATSLKDGDNVPSDFDETAIETAITNGTAALAASDAATKQAAIDALNTAITELQTVITLNASLTSLIASATALKDDAAVPSDFDKTAIETAITNAQAALSSGDSSVKQAAIDALNTEIAALQTVIQNANTVSLADIVSGQKYLLKHVATGMYLRFLDNNDGDFCLNALPNGSNDNFDFIFTAVPGAANTYMLGINSGANTGYMSGSGWNTQLADPATASQKQIILLNQGDNIVWLRAGWLTSNVMNFDCISAACRIYANKSGSANAQFKIELSPNALDMNALIATAR